MLYLLTEREGEAATRLQLETFEVKKVFNWCRNYNMKEWQVTAESETSTEHKNIHLWMNKSASKQVSLTVQCAAFHASWQFKKENSNKQALTGASATW